MIVVDNELVLDLTDQQEDYRKVLTKARGTVLNSDIREFTMVSHLSRSFPVRDLGDILQNAFNLESLSLFSVALHGRTRDFNFLASVLRGHKNLKEVHLVDCGMLGAWENADSSVSTAATGNTRNSAQVLASANARASANLVANAAMRAAIHIASSTPAGTTGAQQQQMQQQLQQLQNSSNQVSNSFAGSGTAGPSSTVDGTGATAMSISGSTLKTNKSISGDVTASAMSTTGGKSVADMSTTAMSTGNATAMSALTAPSHFGTSTSMAAPPPLPNDMLPPTTSTPNTTPAYASNNVPTAKQDNTEWKESRARAAAQMATTMGTAKPKTPAAKSSSKTTSSSKPSASKKSKSSSSQAGGTVPSLDDFSGTSSRTSSTMGHKQRTDGSRASSMTSMTMGPKPPTMDSILNALATIHTLTNVELYGIPRAKYDKRSDGDDESDHKALAIQGERDQDIPMVHMGAEDSVIPSDNDFLDDYDEDIRGIPGNGRPGCSTTRKLSLLMSPQSIGALCKSPNLTNIGLEDLNLQVAHIERLSEALSAKGCKVKELKMWGCGIDDKSSHALAKMLRVNTSLDKLDLSYNQIGDEGCIAIATALKENKTLRILNIMGNACAEDYDKESKGGCYEALMDLLQKNDTLKDLILEPYEQDDASDDIPEYIIVPSTFHDDEASSQSE